MINHEATQVRCQEHELQVASLRLLKAFTSAHYTTTHTSKLTADTIAVEILFEVAKISRFLP